jgi:3-ketosteroid 9alpha-monooxygenase subunit A
MGKHAYRYPFPPYPTGWFAVAYGDELRRGGVKPVDAFGRELVLFRGEDGVARVFDALCPHLGAHLGHGGMVAGNGIVCPFHHWSFDEKGHCVDIPYSSRAIPQQARVRSFPVREVNQAIFVWHDAQQRAPSWELPIVPQAGADDWTRPHSIDRVARFHCQEIPRILARCTASPSRSSRWSRGGTSCGRPPA